MVIKVQYKLKFFYIGSPSNNFMFDFVFTTLSEVKQFVKRMNDPKYLQLNQDYCYMELYKEEYVWNLSSGQVDINSTKITEDF